MPRLTAKTRGLHNVTPGVAPVPSGLGTGTVWLGGGRIGVSVADHGGIEEIRYFGARPIQRSEFFRSNDKLMGYDWYRKGEETLLLQGYSVSVA